MRIFVTGASGWIGSASIAALLADGHTVLGLARSDQSADRVTALGADVHRGTLDDLASLRSGAEEADGVLHLGYVHDFSRMADAARTDLAAIRTFGEVLAGSNRPLLVASGVAGLTPGRPATEQDMPDPNAHPRGVNATAALALANRGVRSVVIRFAPTVHGAGDHGFVARLVEIARERGVSAYVGDGMNRWAAVHRDDAAALVARALQSAPAGSVVHATAEEGITARAIAEAIGRGLDMPVTSVAADEATDHFGWLGPFFAADLQGSSVATQTLLDWNPKHPGLIDDLDQGHYFS